MLFEIRFYVLYRIYLFLFLEKLLSMNLKSLIDESEA